MIRFLVLGLLVFSCASSQAQSNSGSMAAKEPTKEPTSNNANSKRRKPCVFKPAQLNGARTRDSRQIACVLHENKGGIYVLYREALRENPNLSGDIEFSFRIDADGRVQNAKIAHSSLNNPHFENQLLTKLQTFQWPAMVGVSWSGSYPLSFYPIR